MYIVTGDYTSSVWLDALWILLLETIMLYLHSAAVYILWVFGRLYIPVPAVCEWRCAI